MEPWQAILLPVASAAFAAGGAWAAVRVSLRWLRRDVDDVLLEVRALAKRVWQLEVERGRPWTGIERRRPRG